MRQKYRVTIADDHAFLRKGLISILNQSQDFLVVGEAADGPALLDLLHQKTMPDLLILDLSMPVLSGVDVLRQIKQMGLIVKVLVLTMHKEPDLLCQAFLAGAGGYMLKDGISKELLPALHTLLEDRIYLSPLMAQELPGNCKIKAAAEQRLPFLAAKHCKDNPAILQEASIP
jgi:DNA-binding NarL/FixJ family response regulator